MSIGREAKALFGVARERVPAKRIVGALAVAVDFDGAGPVALGAVLDVP